MPLFVTKEQAQRFLLAKNGLLGPSPFAGKEGALAYVRQTGCVQYDPVDVCGKSHELAFLARVKGFDREMLRQLLYEDRSLMDYWEKNMCLVLTQDWPYFEPMRRRYQTDPRGREDIDRVAEEIFAFIRANGPTTSQQLPLKGTVDWYWQESPLSRAALESLYFRGDLVIHHKRHTVRSYALTADHLPAALLATPNPCTTQEDQLAWQALRRIGAVGMLWNRPSDAWLCMEGFTAAARQQTFARLEGEGAIVPVAVEGLPVPLYIRTEDQALLLSCAPPYEGKVEARFVPPLDCLLWDRKLIAALFDFFYKWEIYTPEPQRRYSYYVLPVLYGQRFVGRVEPIADRKAGVLVMKRFWPETGFRPTAPFRKAVQAQAQLLAAFHHLPQIRWEDGFWQNTPREWPQATPTSSAKAISKGERSRPSPNDNPQANPTSAPKNKKE